MPERLSPNIPTWTELNNLLRSLRTERQAMTFLQELRDRGANSRWLKRAGARYRRLRYQREQAEIEQGKMPYKGPRTPKRKFVGYASEGELGRALGFDYVEE